MGRTAWIATGAGVLAAVVAGVVLVAGGSEPAPEAEVRSEVETTTTTTTTTTAPAPAPVVAPLTGLPQPEDRLGLLERPALVVKVDNAPEAMPQQGLELADMVIEVQVEGISRFIAAFHSQDVGEVTPVRSARTGDPEILAMFGRPLVAWSGANPTTTRVMRDTPWIQNIDVDRFDGYSRVSDRSAPHNLRLDARAAFGVADQPPAVPQEMFPRFDPAAQPQGTPVAGFDVAIGKTPVSWVWDAERGGWLRWAYGRSHTDVAGQQLAPTNVVVLETPYGTSPADRETPEARTVGTGRAWVFAGGNMYEGVWNRPDATTPWQLSTPTGEPLLLAPGPAWIEVAPTGSGPGLFDAARAEALRAG